MNLKANRIQKTVLKEEIGKHVHKSKYRTFKKTETMLEYLRTEPVVCVCMFICIWRERER